MKGDEEDEDCPTVCRHLLCTGGSGLQSLGRWDIVDKLGIVGVSFLFST